MSSEYKEKIMLDKHLIVKTSPLANKENVVQWKNYRVTVLQDRLFRIENSDKGKFRDEATQSVWYRDMEKQTFTLQAEDTQAVIQTARCRLVLKGKREDCYIEWDGLQRPIDNAGNLKGTYRTLDACNGVTNYPKMFSGNPEITQPVTLGNGVCSTTGVAVFDDASSLTLGQDGEIKAERGDGTDEYVFAYGNDYRAAVRALYLITGNTPLVPRFALGNWWSRYHVYTQDEYLRILQRFEDRDVPLTVATIDMDWHWSTQMENDLHIIKKGRNTPFYGGNSGWTGYSWNTRLFPDYKAFLKEIQDRGLKITLNLHPADGVRWWEDMYGEMAKELGRDASTGEKIRFDIADTNFVNAYFKVLHKPYEKDGVTFWWIDWQQGTQSGLDGLDPLWSLNHYHYLDNAENHFAPLILSRFCGVGSHRYPLGFSGDTFCTWATLDYLPYFTATATNVGYTWWSHDIGGHMLGAKEDEQYARHIQFGVFSPINRLHSSNAETVTKEPWEYKNGTGTVIQDWLRLRHRLIPYLYSASYRTHRQGTALIEPLYYQWDTPKAYEYKNEYLFGGQMLVAPVTQKCEADGYARVRVWIPEGKWTDIFTGDRYIAPKGGVEKTLLRTLESIPVLIKDGGVLPLSMDKGNSVENPEKLEVSVWNGNGEFVLFEDGRTQGNTQSVYTRFVNTYTQTTGAGMQSLTIKAEGDIGVLPQNRTLRVVFKELAPETRVCVYKNGKALVLQKIYADDAAAEFVFDPTAEYLVTAEVCPCTEKQERTARALKVLIASEGEIAQKEKTWGAIRAAETVDAYLEAVQTSALSNGVKLRLLETL